MRRVEVYPQECTNLRGDKTGSPTQSLRRFSSHRSAAALRAAYRRHRGMIRGGSLDSDESFPWINCFVSLFAYALLLSDVFRTELAIKTVPYRTVEPDTYEYFGPFAYVTKHLTVANATMTDTTGFWAYKYDTTSVTMRSVAEHLDLQHWPACVLYRERCDESAGIPLGTIFLMIDSLVDGVSKHDGIAASRLSRSRSRGVLTLRIGVEYKDRVHHYALPWFFARNTIHTSQAIHFEYNASQSVLYSCSDTIAARRPYSCTQNWTHFYRLGCTNSTSDDPAACQFDAPRVWDLIPKRIAHLAAQYPGSTIDYVVLDGMDDYKRGGLVFKGRKTGVDVVLLSRVRKCDTISGVCSTVAVDDYRFEAATLVMNAPDWYLPVAILRAVAQTYAWLRLAMLLAGSHAAHLQDQWFRDAALQTRAIATLRTVFLIPSQVVIYGCSFPINLYLLAHLIDSPAAYELVAAFFTSILGQMDWSLRAIIQQCAISMRTVWVVSFMCHRLLTLTTSCTWSPTHGITGASDFAITIIASLTIFAQYRSLSFRRLRILEINEIPQSARRAQLFADSTSSYHSTINNLIGGSTVDAQCILCGFLGLLVVSMVTWAINHAFPKYVPVYFRLASNTTAPYSAGMLWSPNRLVVSWHGSILSFDNQKTAGEIKPASPTARSLVTSQVQKPPLASTHIQNRKRMDAADRVITERDLTTSSLVQRDLHIVDGRTRQEESIVYLVNLAVMTDLLTFFNLRVGDGRLVGLYQSKATRRCFLLPYGLLSSNADIPIDWNELILMAVVNSRDMAWTDLLSCG